MASTPAVGSNLPDRRLGILGTGLDRSVVALIVAITVGVFLLWDGPLWLAPSGKSHLGRIIVSYAAALPLIAAALLALNRFGWTRFLTSSALVWAIKLLITESLYLGIAPGSVQRYQPIKPWASREPTNEPDREPAYQAARGRPGTGTGTIAGRVTRGGRGVAGAIVYLLSPKSGRDLPSATEVQVRIRDARYERSAYAVTRRDRLIVSNRDAALHTLKIARDERSASDHPVPGGDRVQSISAPPPGSYTMSCDNHPSERALLEVFDHPYFTTSAADGDFELTDVPVGTNAIAASVEDGSHARTEITVTIDQASHVRLEMDETER
jgi:hypothetical protein